MKKSKKPLLNKQFGLNSILCFLMLISFIGESNNFQENGTINSPNISSTDFLSVKGNLIVDQDNNEIKLRGIQFDFGSVRGDINYNKFDEDLNEYFDRMLEFIVSEDDFIDAKSMGVNAIRLSLNTYLDFEERPHNFNQLDKIVEYAEKYQIYLIISMRQSPGGHNPSAHSGNDGKNELWDNSTHQQRITTLWSTIAERHVNRSIIIGYDLLNEPLAPNKTILNQVYNDISQAIRKVDNNHIIILEGNNWTKDMDWVDNPIDSNTALSFHFYEPGPYAVNGEGTYPSEIQGQLFNKEVVRTTLLSRLDYIKSINSCEIVGEFGAMTKAGNYLDYDQDIIDIMEEEKLNWIYWNYKNVKGNSDTQALYYINESNELLNLLYEIEGGESISEYTNTELNQTLEFLDTSSYYLKTDLKQLLIDCIIQTNATEINDDEKIKETDNNFISGPNFYFIGIAFFITILITKIRYVNICK